MSNTNINHLVTKLRNWQTVYPEDYDKPDYSLYLEAADAIVAMSELAKEDALQYLADTGQLFERIDELTAVLKAVDQWIDDLSPYADFEAEPVTVFKEVKRVLGVAKSNCDGETK